MSFFGPRLSLPLLAVAIAVPVPTAYQELLADDGQETVALLKLDAWEIGAGGANARRLPRLGGPLWIGAGEDGVGGTVPFYWSDDLWAGDPDDADLPNRSFAERLLEVRITRTLPILPGGFTGGGSARVQVDGEATLDNTDGALDGIVRRFQSGGRAVEIRLGRPSDAWADCGLVAGLVAGTWVGGPVVRVPLRARDYLLETAFRDLYAGTGGIEGGDDLKGKPKERTWGPAENVPVTMLNADLIFSVNGGRPVKAISAVYDRVVPLAFCGTDYADYASLEAATTGDAGSGADIEAGEYATCLALGLGKLGGSPDGKVTANVEGDTRDGDGYVSRRGDVCLAIVAETGFDPAWLDSASWSRLSGEVALFLGTEESETAAAVLDRLVGPLGKWGGGRDGRIRVYQLSDPDARTPVATLTEDRLLSLEPEEWQPPSWRWRVDYAPSWTVQDEDLDTAATAARKAFVAQARRTVPSAPNLSAIRIDFPDALDGGPVDSLFAEETPAQELADALLALHRPDAETNEVLGLKRGEAARQGLAWDLADPLRLIWSRYGLTAGRTHLVVEWDLELSRRAVTLQFLGRG